MSVFPILYVFHFSFSFSFLIGFCVFVARADAVELGQKMLSKGYMYHVTGDRQFEDDELWYVFDDELIENVKSNLDESLHDQIYVKVSNP